MKYLFRNMETGQVVMMEPSSPGGRVLSAQIIQGLQNQLMGEAVQMMEGSGPYKVDVYPAGGMVEIPGDSLGTYLVIRDERGVVVDRLA